jgi:hypothetical protein
MIPIPWSLILKGGLGFLKRFWPVILIGLLVWHYVGLRITVSDQAHIITSMEIDLKASRDVVGRCQVMTVTIDELEAANVEADEMLATCMVDSGAWEAAFADEIAKPPRVEVEIRDRVVGDTAETMAETGARIASELAEGLRDRLDGGIP